MAACNFFSNYQSVVNSRYNAKLIHSTYEIYSTIPTSGKHNSNTTSAHAVNATIHACRVVSGNPSEEAWMKCLLCVHTAMKYKKIWIPKDSNCCCGIAL